jgi:hypothetical protein
MDTILDFAKSLLPPVRHKILHFYANIKKCCKPHAVPFNLHFHNISKILIVLQSLQHHMNGATKIKKIIFLLTILLIGAANW